MSTLQRKKYFQGGTTEMCTVHRNRTLSRRYIRNMYCAQKQNTFRRYIRNVCCVQKQKTFQAVHQKCVLCTETEHFQTIHQKCVVCTETEHFPDGTHKAVFIDHKTILRTDLSELHHSYIPTYVINAN